MIGLFSHPSRILSRSFLVPDSHHIVDVLESYVPLFATVFISVLEIPLLIRDKTSQFQRPLNVQPKIMQTDQMPAILGMAHRVCKRNSVLQQKHTHWTCTRRTRQLVPRLTTLTKTDLSSP